MDIIPQGSHLHFLHPWVSGNNYPWVSIKDKTFDSNKLQGRLAHCTYVLRKQIWRTTIYVARNLAPNNEQKFILQQTVEVAKAA